MKLNTERRHNPQPWGDGEIDTIYVTPSDRFVVSMIVGYTTSDLKGGVLPGKRNLTREPRGSRDFALLAGAAALDLLEDEGSADTQWFVYDRLTGQMHEFEQHEFDNAYMP